MAARTAVAAVRNSFGVPPARCCCNRAQRALAGGFAAFPTPCLLAQRATLASRPGLSEAAVRSFVMESCIGDHVCALVAVQRGFLWPRPHPVGQISSFMVVARCIGRLSGSSPSAVLSPSGADHSGSARASRPGLPGWGGCASARREFPAGQGFRW